MKTLQLVILVIVAMAICACGQKNDSAKVTEQQKEVNAKWDKAMNAGDADALASLYADDAIRMSPNEPVWEGKDAIHNGFRSLLEKNSVNGVNLVTGVILTDDYAIVRGTSKYDVIPKTGGETIHGEGKYLDIRKRQPDGSWKSVLSIWNSDLPPVIMNQ